MYQHLLKIATAMAYAYLDEAKSTKTTVAPRATVVNPTTPTSKFVVVRRREPIMINSKIPSTKLEVAYLLTYGETGKEVGMIYTTEGRVKVEIITELEKESLIAELAKVCDNLQIETTVLNQFKDQLAHHGFVPSGTDSVYDNVVCYTTTVPVDTDALICHSDTGQYPD